MLGIQHLWRSRSCATELHPESDCGFILMRRFRRQWFSVGLGALFAGWLIHLSPEGGLAGMGSLLVCALGVTAFAATAGLAPAQATASPAARAASANKRWRVAASLVRSVRTSMTRTPGSPT